MKDMLDLLIEFEEFGYVIHECPICGCECDETEIDADTAYCSECDDYVEVRRVL